VIANVPIVGADVQDHPQVRMQYRSPEPITMNDVVNHWRHRMHAGLRYCLWRKGLLAVGAGYAGGFFRAMPLAVTPDEVRRIVVLLEAAHRSSERAGTPVDVRGG